MSCIHFYLINRSIYERNSDFCARFDAKKDERDAIHSKFIRKTKPYMKNVAYVFVHVLNDHIKSVRCRTKTPNFLFNSKEQEHNFNKRHNIYTFRAQNSNSQFDF